MWILEGEGSSEGRGKVGGIGIEEGGRVCKGYLWWERVWWRETGIDACLRIELDSMLCG